MPTTSAARSGLRCNAGGSISSASAARPTVLPRRRVVPLSARFVCLADDRHSGAAAAAGLRHGGSAARRTYANGVYSQAPGRAMWWSRSPGAEVAQRYSPAPPPRPCGTRSSTRSGTEEAQSEATGRDAIAGHHAAEAHGRCGVFPARGSLHGRRATRYGYIADGPAPAANPCRLQTPDAATGSRASAAARGPRCGIAWAVIGT